MKRSKERPASHISGDQYGIGNKILKKWGFKGGGLGKYGQGITSPILPVQFQNREGLGSRPLKPVDKVVREIEIADKSNMDNNIQLLKPLTSDNLKIHETTSLPKKTKAQNLTKDLANEDALAADFIETLSTKVQDIYNTFMIDYEHLNAHNTDYIQFLDGDASSIYQLTSQAEDDLNSRNYSELNEIIGTPQYANRLDWIKYTSEFVERCMHWGNDVPYVLIMRNFEILQKALSDSDYSKCKLGNLSLVLFFRSMSEYVSSWKLRNIAINQLGDDVHSSVQNYRNLIFDTLEFHVDTFLDWKQFIRNQLTFESHGLWNDILLKVHAKVRSVFKLLDQNINEQSLLDIDDLCVHLLRLWNRLINLDTVVESVVIPYLVKKVEVTAFENYEKLLHIIDRYWRTLDYSIEPVFIALFGKIRKYFASDGEMSEPILETVKKLSTWYPLTKKILVDEILLLPLIKYLESIDMFEGMGLSSHVIDILWTYVDLMDEETLIFILIDTVFPILNDFVRKTMRQDDPDVDLVVGVYQDYKDFLIRSGLLLMDPILIKKNQLLMLMDTEADEHLSS